MEFTKRNIKLFIISGKAKSGKNTIANIIKDYYKDKKVITISFAYYIKDYAKRIIGWDGSEENKPREFLQNFGIELVKNKIDSKLFINRILEDINIFSYFYDVIIIDDARLKDEIETVKDNYKDSITIRVNRNNYNNGLTTHENNHITETDLDEYNNFDYIINNDNYIDLKKEIEEILRRI